MAPVEDVEARMSVLEEILPTLATKKDLAKLDAKVDKNHQTVMGTLAKAHAEQMAMLESMKNLGRDPNY